MPYCLYAIELSPGVLDEAKFVARNPDRRSDKPCISVGQTALTPEERLAQHQAGYKSCRLAHKYGTRLRPKLVANRGQFETRDEALKAEAALADRLRRKGYAVWSN